VKVSGRHLGSAMFASPLRFSEYKEHEFSDKLSQELFLQVETYESRRWCIQFVSS